MKIEGHLYDLLRQFITMLVKEAEDTHILIQPPSLLYYNRQCLLFFTHVHTVLSVFLLHLCLLHD